MTKIFTLNSVAPEFLMDQLAEVREVDESSFGNFVGDVHDLLMILIQAMSPNDLQWLLTNKNCEKPDGLSTFNWIECINSDQQPFFFSYEIQCHGQSWSVSGWPCHCDLKSAIFDPPCTWEKDGRGQSGPKSCFPITIDVIRGDKEFPRRYQAPCLTLPLWPDFDLKISHFWPPRAQAGRVAGVIAALNHVFPLI